MTLTVECRPDLLVSQLKRIINERKSELTVLRQRLMLIHDEDDVDFRILANSHTLASYDIVNDTTVQLVMTETLPPFERVRYFDMRLISSNPNCI